MVYRYEAYTPKGDRVRGRLEAPSEETAEDLLWRQEYTVVSIQKARDRTGGLLPFLGKVKPADLAVFSRQLATLIQSGIPILRSLRLLGEQVPSRQLRQVLSDIVADVERGSLLSEAILRKSNAFPTFYGRLIEIGERTGNLESVLRELAAYLEKEEAVSRQIRGALAYPGFVLAMACGVVFVLLTVALPPLTDMFLNFDVRLPLPTRMLIALTGFLSTYKFHLLGAVVFFLIAAFRFAQTEGGRLLLDRALLRLPVVGRLIIRGALSRMCRAMSALLRAGVPMAEIMALVIRTQGNRLIAGALVRVRDELLQGHGLADPLAHQGMFPSLLIQMVRVGEETGSLDDSLETLADFYEEEVDRTVSALARAVEPALTVLVGLVVGFVALSMIMPMYSLMGAIR
ncbi:MAG TPA: type II secretion system F family protein [Anaerolineae bacterium]|nr:type II secretion system F family protein [Anaerolineae bacterium]